MHRFKSYIAAAVLCWAGAAVAQSSATVIMPANPRALAAQTEYGYADAVIAGDMIFLSGVIVGPRPGEVGLEAAYERAFAHIGDVLKRSGASFEDVVDITSFHTDIPSQVETMTKVKKRHIPNGPPAWTVIGTTGLFEPTGVTEIKVIAYLPRKAK